MILETAYGDGHPLVGRALANLAIVLRDLGDQPGAQQHMVEALAIFGTTYGLDHREAGIVLNNVSLLILDALTPRQHRRLRRAIERGERKR